MSENENISYRLKSLEESVDELKANNSNTHQKFFDRLEDLSTKHAVAENNYLNLYSLMSDIKSDLSALKDKPAKRWDTIIAAAITAIVSVVVTLAFSGKI